jgi:hypothetical protein
LLSKSPLTYAYCHLIIASNFLILPCAIRKGEPKFFMVAEVREKLVVIVEDR